MNLYNVLLATACAVIAPNAWAQSAAPGAAQKQEEVPTYPLYPAEKLIGLNIHNDSDKGLGEIGDLLIDPASGEIRYAVLDVGGFLGAGEDHRVVPWSFVQVVPDEKDREKCHGRTTLTEAQIKSAPTAKKDAKFDSDLDKRIEATFGKNDAWAYVGKGNATFLRCSQLDDVVLRDPMKKEIGKIQSLILAPTGSCVAYAVVDTTKDAGDKDVAVPFSRIQYAWDDDKKLVATTPIEFTKFATAPEYDKKDWKRMSSKAWVTEISTFYGADPFWKSARPATAPKPPPPSKT